MPNVSGFVHMFRMLAIAGIALMALALSTDRAFASDDPAQSLHERIDRLEATVRAQEAIRVVKRIQHTYAHYLESGLWSDLADLFTQDAIAELPTGTVRGRSQLRRHFMQQAERASPGLARGQLNVHLIMQPIVTVSADGRSVMGTWHEMEMLGRFGSSASWRGGVYENEYTLENGVWKISRLRYFEQYRGAYDDFGHQAPPAWKIPYHFDASDVGVTIPASALESLARESAAGADGERVGALARRVQRLNDETEVRNLQHSFGYYLDRKMWDDVADLFADGGSLELASRGVYIGRERIRRALEVLYGPPRLRHGELFDHIQLGTVVTVSADGRSAAARTTELRMLGVNGEYAQWEVGTYENRFVREEGTWKLMAVRYFPRMVTDYDEGWARDAKPAPGPVSDFPPDRPSAKYESYPVAHVVGFHYRNPATGRAVRYPSGALVRVQEIEERPLPRAVKEDTGDLAPRIEELERKLDLAIAVDAVENLNSSYGYYIDESAWDEMADTFASTGSKEITGAGVYVGPERIRKVLNLRGPRGGRTPGFFTIHQLVQPVIHVSEDGLTAKARLRLFQCGGSADGSTGSWIGGIYENTAVREDGEWKFGVQDLHHLFNASYRNGWARVGDVTSLRTSRPDNPRNVRGGGIRQGLGGAASGSRIASEMPPDRPIRAKQYAFPEIVEPAFHYRNPVSGRMPPELLP